MPIIKVKRSTAAGKAPADSSLEAGELAVNLADKKIFTADTTGKTIALGGKETLEDLTDTTTTTAGPGSILVFDETTKKWKNAETLDLGEFVGAPPPFTGTMQIRVWAPSEAKAAPVEVHDSNFQIGSYTSRNLGDGSYMIESDDDITRVNWTDNKDITRVDVIKGDTIIDAIEAWKRCSSLVSFDASGLTAVINVSNAWNGCTKMTSFDASGLSAVLDASFAWGFCKGMTHFDSTSLTSVTDANHAWKQCSTLISFDASGLTSVKNIEWAWSYCSNLTCITSMTAPTNNVSRAFDVCTKLTAPNPTEQTAHFTDTGTDWNNPNPCPAP